MAQAQTVAQLRRWTAASATGTGHISGGGEHGCLRLRAGLLVDVQAPSTPPDLGHALIAAGVLSRRRLQRLTRRGPLAEAELAAVLLEQRLVAVADINDAVRARLAAGLAELISWPSAQCELRLGEPMADSLVAADLESVLEVASQRPTLRTVLPPGAVPRRSTPAQPIALALPPAGWSLLCALDGETSVSDAARRCGLGVQRAGLLATELSAAGLITTGSAPRVDGSRAGGSGHQVRKATAPAHTAEQAAVVVTDEQAERIAGWRQAAATEARAMAIEHARFSAEFDAYEEKAFREGWA